jgi:hypothetical protein
MFIEMIDGPLTHSVLTDVDHLNVDQARKSSSGISTCSETTFQTFAVRLGFRRRGCRRHFDGALFDFSECLLVALDESLGELVFPLG